MVFLTAGMVRTENYQSHLHVLTHSLTTKKETHGNLNIKYFFDITISKMFLSLIFTIILNKANLKRVYFYILYENENI